MLKGYVVFRQPKFNFDELSRGIYSNELPQRNGVYYSGVDRMQWFDFDESFYAGELSKDNICLREKLYRECSVECDVKLMSSISDSKSILGISKKDRNELCYVEVLGLEGYQFAEVEGENFLGFDVICNGYGSLLREGYFSENEKYSEYSDVVNKSGLFDFHPEEIKKYVDCFRRSSSETIEGRVFVAKVWRVVS